MLAIVEDLTVELGSHPFIIYIPHPPDSQANPKTPSRKGQSYRYPLEKEKAGHCEQWFPEQQEGTVP